MPGQFLLPTYKRSPILFTPRSRRILFSIQTARNISTFLGGIAVNALGHAHPRIVKTISPRIRPVRFIFQIFFHNEFQGPLARKLSEWSGLGPAYFFRNKRHPKPSMALLKLARLCGRPAPGGTLARRPPRHAFPRHAEFLSTDAPSARSALTSTEKIPRAV